MQAQTLNILKPYRAIFWDLDGTLIRNEILWWRATWAVLLGHNIYLSFLDYKSFYAYFGIDPVTHPTKSLLLSSRRARTHKMRLKLFQNMLISDSFERPGIKLAIQKLHNMKFFQGIVTGSKLQHVNLLTSKFRFLDSLPVLSTYESTSFHKPHPAPYTHALQQLNIDPSECLAIEDSLPGVLSAHAAGIACWLLRSQMTCSESTKLADVVLDSPLTLATLLS